MALTFERSLSMSDGQDASAVGNGEWHQKITDEQFYTVAAFALLEAGVPVAPEYIELAKQRRLAEGRDPETGLPLGDETLTIAEA